MRHIPVSELPVGATGYKKASEEQVLNTLADDKSIQIIEATDFLKQIVVPGTYSLPRSLNTLSWWKVFNQGAIGSCLGSSDSQTATGVYWLKTGKVIEFCKFGHYLAIQLMADLKGCRPLSIGKDQGSIPSFALIVAAKWGYCPEVWDQALEEMFVAAYGSASGYKNGQPLAPPYPRNYADGLRAYGPWLQDLKNPNSQLRKVMAMFRMDKYIRITKTEHILKAKRAGIGFIQQSSLWHKSFDSHATRIDDFGGPGSGPHSGGHAYQVMDITPDDEFIIGNTWGPGNAQGDTHSTQGWGDEGAKVASQQAEQAIIDDPMTLVYLKTDMEYVKTAPQGPREIPIEKDDWT